MIFLKMNAFAFICLVLTIFLSGMYIGIQMGEQKKSEFFDEEDK